MRARLFRLFACLSVTLMLGACATGPDIRTDFNPNTNFSAYRTFGFVAKPGTDRQGYESLTTQYLKAAVQRQMTERGYQFNPQAPDLLINFNARLHQRIVTDPAPLPPPGYIGYYGYRGGLYGPWPGYGFYSDTYSFTEGTLNIDIVDARKNQLVWEGIARGAPEDTDPQGNPQGIDKVVAQIFARYPFRAGQ